jgi:hypothetical protein
MAKACSSSSIRLPETGRRLWRFHRRRTIAGGSISGKDIEGSVTLLKPAALLPLPGLEQAGVSGVVGDDALEQIVHPLEVDWFQDPAVESGLDVLLALAFNQGGGDGEDGNAAVDGRSWRETGLSVRLLEGTDDLGGREAVNDWHLERSKGFG